MGEQNLSDELSPGQRLLWYRIDNVIGRGAFGITYLAEDINLHRAVAIKEFFPKQYCGRASDAVTVQPLSEESASQFKWALDRFMSEARTLAQLEHPNIIRVNNVFAKNGTAYMVMNYEDGVSFASLLKQEGTISEARLTRLISPLLSGLEKIHDSGFIHRDIKPANIYIREDGMPVLIDFGSARQSIQEHDESLTGMVSPGYAPIEQYTKHGGQQGPWTDIYGLAATLYRAVTGKAPPAAIDRSEAIAQGYNDNIDTLFDNTRHQYSSQFLNAIKHGLAFRIHERPQTIGAWRSEFNHDAPEDTEADDTDFPEWSADAPGTAAFTASDHNETHGLDDHAATTEHQEDERTSQLRAILETGLLDEQDAGAANTTKSAAASTQKASTAADSNDDDIADYTRTEILGPEEHGNVINSMQNRQQMRFQDPDPADDFNDAASDLPSMTPLASEDPVAEMSITHEPPGGQSRVRRHKVAYFALTGTLCLVLAGVLASVPYTDTLNRTIADLQDAITASTAGLSPDELFPDNDADTAGPNQATDEPASREQSAESAESAATADTEEPLDFEKIPTQQVAEQADRQEQNEEQDEIERLLSAAENDIRARRLTTPEGNNAYEKYQAVLTKDADNQEAREGLNNILNVYLMIAEQSLEQGNTQHAEKMLTRASKIDSDSPRLLQVQSAIRQQQSRQDSRAAPQQTRQRAPLSPPLHN